MKRREFITLVGGTAAWPIAARAQHPAKTIGFLGSAAIARTRSDRGSHHHDRESVGGGKRSERFAEIAAEFIRLKVDIIVTSEQLPFLLSKLTSHSTDFRVQIFCLTSSSIPAGKPQEVSDPG